MTPMMDDERESHEWSHDAYMISCVYPNTIGCYLVICDVALMST